jgi:hypothetical protein
MLPERKTSKCTLKRHSRGNRRTGNLDAQYLPEGNRGFPPRPKSSLSPRSLPGLDGLDFLMADVRDGLGLFLFVYLKDTRFRSPAPV